VFIDESGLSERPHCCRTWSPKGQTPVLQYHFNWKHLSAMAGVSWTKFYFRLFPGSIRSPQVVEFLKHLLRQIKGKVLVIWDGLRSHRSRMVGEYVRSAPKSARHTVPFFNHSGRRTRGAGFDNSTILRGSTLLKSMNRLIMA